MNENVLPPVGGDESDIDSNLPPEGGLGGIAGAGAIDDALVSGTAPHLLPAASLATGDIAPAETVAGAQPVHQEATAAQAAAATAAEPAVTPVARLPLPDDEAETQTGTAQSEPQRESLSDRAARWLPTTGQLADAARLRIARALGPDYVPDDPRIAFVPGMHTSMRQSFGLIVAVGLISGVGRMIWLWVLLARAGTVMPLQRLDTWSAWMAARFPTVDSFLLINQQVSGLSPRAPAWVAAGLNALGDWLSLPMRLLALWIVYGLFMLLVAKLFGAGTTLPRFYAALGYVAVPLLLLMLRPLPFVGLIGVVAAILLAIVALYRAVRATTELDGARTLMVMLLPAVLVLALWGLFGVIAATVALV